MSARDKFVGIKADYWDCADSERLTHDDPISALEDWVDSHLSPNCDVEKEIREMGDVEVSAYERATISERDINGAVERAMDDAVTALDEDTIYGDPEGDHQMFSKDTLAKHRPAFEAAVRALATDAHVWHCEVSQKVTLAPDEVLEIMRVERPDWFEVQS